MKKLLSISILFVLPFFAQSQCSEEIYTGEGTYYDFDQLGNCSFPKPYGNLYAGAINASQYAIADLCGACAEITGEGGKLVVALVDQCPECAYGDIDLEKDAFPFIAEPIRGRVPISWKVIPCPFQGPVELYFKEGSTKWWTAVQVRNHINPIASLELKINGVYVNVPRQSYNYFLKDDGMGDGPFDFRITDVYGNMIEETNIPLLITTPVEGESQFPTCVLTSTFNKEEPLNISCYRSNGNLIVVNSENTDAEAYIINSTGLEVASGKIPGNSEKSFPVGSQSFHLVRLITDKGTFVKKVLK